MSRKQSYSQWFLHFLLIWFVECISLEDHSDHRFFSILNLIVFLNKSYEGSYSKDHHFDFSLGLLKVCSLHGLHSSHLPNLFEFVNARKCDSHYAYLIHHFKQVKDISSLVDESIQLSIKQRYKPFKQNLMRLHDYLLEKEWHTIIKQISKLS